MEEEAYEEAREMIAKPGVLLVIPHLMSPTYAGDFFLRVFIESNPLPEEAYLF